MLDKIIKSSHNPKDVSLAVRGALMHVLAIVVLIGGSDPLNGGGVELVDKISAIAGTLILLVGQLWVVWGLIRKLWAPK